jgi:hypothetical protein
MKRASSCVSGLRKPSSITAAVCANSA